MTESLEKLRAKLNTQTGKILWPEIQRCFARGVVLVVDHHADLLKIAADIVHDNQAVVEDCLAAGELKRASVEDARSWQKRDPLFWAVVAAPWVLVQEIKDD
jgi:hypothetical protein